MVTSAGWLLCGGGWLGGGGVDDLGEWGGDRRGGSGGGGGIPSPRQAALHNTVIWLEKRLLQLLNTQQHPLV